MSDVGIHIRCMRCSTQMDMRDPGPDMEGAGSILGVPERRSPLDDLSATVAKAKPAAPEPTA
jgi:hypothetical protein